MNPAHDWNLSLVIPSWKLSVKHVISAESCQALQVKEKTAGGHPVSCLWLASRMRHWSGTDSKLSLHQAWQGSHPLCSDGVTVFQGTLTFDIQNQTLAQEWAVTANPWSRLKVERGEGKAFGNNTVAVCDMAGLAKLRVERSNTQKLSAELYSTHMLGHMDTTNITHTCTYARTQTPVHWYQ